MLGSNLGAAVVVLVVGAGSFFATLAMLDEPGAQPSRTNDAFTYSTPQVNGRPIDVTPADWNPSVTPFKTAVKQTADTLCQKLGHKRATTYAYLANQPPGAERFLAPNDPRTIFCDSCRANFTQVACER